MRKNSLRILFLILFTIIALPCFAAENVISSVTISNSKERANAYELSVDSTKITQFKSHLDEDGNIYFDLKNSILAPEIGTIYDDVTNIDNVVVRQLDKNKVRIYIEGKNAKNTELVFVNSLLETKDPSKKVVINRPLSDYQPTNQNIDDSEIIQGWNDNSFNLSQLLSAILSSLREGPLGIVLIILSIFAFSAFIIKSLTKKLSLDNEPLIGLNQNINKEPIQEQEELDDLSKRSETIKKAQIELGLAHKKYQDYLKNKYSTKPKAQVYDPIKKGIALNQYQKSTKNPYLEQEVIKLNQKESVGIPKRENIQKFTSPYIQRPNKKVEKPAVKQTIKSDNLKFLESVTKIYEQSGRSDLANGLKSSLSRVKQSI